MRSQNVIIMTNAGKCIFIFAVSPMTVNLNCYSSFSCEEFSMELNDESKSDIILTTNIVCFTDNACDYLFINTDDSRNIFIALDMKQYSKDITIDHHYFDNIEVI